MKRLAFYSDNGLWYCNAFNGSAVFKGVHSDVYNAIGDDNGGDATASFKAFIPKAHNVVAAKLTWNRNLTAQ